MQKIAGFLLHQATAAKKTSNRVSSTTRLAQDTWNFHQKVGRGLMVFHHATDRSVGRIHQQHTPPVSWSTMPSQRSVLMYWTGRNFWFVIFLCIHGLSFLGKFASRWHGDMEGTWYLASVCCNSSSFVALLQVKLGEGTWWQELMMEWLNNSASINYRWLDDIDGILVFFEQLQQFVKVAEESGLLLVILPGQVHLYAKSDHKNQQNNTQVYASICLQIC